MKFIILLFFLAIAVAGIESSNEISSFMNLFIILKSDR